MLAAPCSSNRFRGRPLLNVAAPIELARSGRRGETEVWTLLTGEETDNPLGYLQPDRSWITGAPTV